MVSGKAQGHVRIQLSELVVHERAYLSPRQTLGHHWSNDEAEEGGARMAKRESPLISPVWAVGKRGRNLGTRSPQDKCWEGKRRRLAMMGRAGALCSLSIQNIYKKKVTWISTPCSNMVTHPCANKNLAGWMSSHLGHLKWGPKVNGSGRA